MGEHEESREEAGPETSPFYWEQWMHANFKSMETAKDFWQKSADAGKDASKIAERHIEKMTERLNDLRKKDASARELYREMTKHYTAMTEEILQSDAVLRLYAGNLEAFLDWKIAMKDSQEWFLKLTGLPTRDEMTDIYKELHDLRRKVHRISESDNGGGSSGSGK